MRMLWLLLAAACNPGDDTGDTGDDTGDDCPGATWSFEEGTSASTGGSESTGVAAGDVDGDGAMDLLVVDGPTATVSVFPGGGDGTLGAAAGFDVGTDPVWLVAGDLDGDDLADAVVANYAGAVVTTLLADGAGGLGAASPSPTMDYSPNVIVLADFDDDQKLDVGYSANGDGGVLKGDGDGLFAASVSEPLPSGLGVAAAPFDDDGNLDLALGSYEGPVKVLLLDGAGGVSSVHTLDTLDEVTGVAAADLDGDEKTDLVVINDLGDIEALLGAGDGTFTSSWTGSATLELYSLALGDLDDDGHVDLVVGGIGVGLFRGVGDGTFGAMEELTGNVDIGAVTLADFTGDGHDDIAYATVAGDAAVFTATRTCP